MKDQSVNVNGMKKEIRRIVEAVAKFECESCGKQVKRAGKFEYRHPQYISSHLAEILTVCRQCCYKLSFGTKGTNVRKREKQIENESPKYANYN